MFKKKKIKINGKLTLVCERVVFITRLILKKIVLLESIKNIRKEAPFEKKRVVN